MVIVERYSQGYQRYNTLLEAVQRDSLREYLEAMRIQRTWSLETRFDFTSRKITYYLLFRTIMAPPRSKKGVKRKGEVNEITRTLEQLSALDGRKKDVIYLKRECFQKLIKYMTSGIDMSSVFVSATKCVALSKNDLPLKKMLYLYLRSAARQNSSLSLLVVQTLLNDSKDVDPRIRGLAVRSMCSLRVPELLENVLPVVTEGLKDPNAYVREVAVIGVLKCFHQDQEKIKALGLIEEVKELLKTDQDTQVITSCLYVLQNLRALHASTLSKPLMISFMNNIRNFSEWGQCLLMEILLKYYRPETEVERFDVLEVLDSGLNHTNSAVILATAKLFLHYTSNYKDQYEQVIRLTLGPWRTILMGREPEVAYAALCNVKVLAQRHPEPFYVMADDLFYRFDDPSYLKLSKLDVLVLLSHVDNAFDTAEEAFEYARDFDDDVARHAIRVISRIAIKVGSVDGILDRLLLFLNHRRSVIVGETVVAFASALNKFPSAAEICVPSISRVRYDALNSSESQSAFIWIMGQFGDTIQEAPYLLEDICEAFENQDGKVKLSMLTSAINLFCKRPPECLRLAKHVLQKALGDTDFVLSEKASIYASLLETLGRDGTKPIVQLPPIIQGQEFILDTSEEVQDKLFDEWNSLSVIYGAPAMTFIEEEEDSLTRFESGSLGGDIAIDDVGMESLIDTQEIHSDTVDFVDSNGREQAFVNLGDLLGDEFSEHALAEADEFSFDTAPSKMPEQSSKGTDSYNTNHELFDLDYLMKETLITDQADGDQQRTQPELASEAVQLMNHDSLSMNQDDFKRFWNELAIFSVTFQYQFDSPAVLNMVASDGFMTFENHVKQANLKCLGKPANAAMQPYRFFFYGKSTNNVFVLLSVVIDGQSALIDVRSEDMTLTNTIKDMLTTLLLTFN